MNVRGERARCVRKMPSAAPIDCGGSTAIARSASSIRGSLACGSLAASTGGEPGVRLLVGLGGDHLGQVRRLFAEPDQERRRRPAGGRW